MIIRFLEHSALGVYPGIHSGDGTPVKADAVAMMGGELSEWSLRTEDFDSAEIALIEPDGLGGYDVTYGKSVSASGLKVDLVRAWVSGAKISSPDSHTFASPTTDTAIAVDLLDSGLGIYTWDSAEEVKGDPDPGDTVFAVDIIRGVLLAGATDLKNLGDE